MFSLIEATVKGTPPSRATFLIARSAANPSHFPSGEKNGYLAFSVPASATVSDRSKQRM
jgi:hypothetical protein